MFRFSVSNPPDSDRNNGGSGRKPLFGKFSLVNSNNNNNNNSSSSSSTNPLQLAAVEDINGYVNVSGSGNTDHLQTGPPPPSLLVYNPIDSNYQYQQQQSFIQDLIILNIKIHDTSICTPFQLPPHIVDILSVSDQDRPKFNFDFERQVLKQIAESVSEKPPTWAPTTHFSTNMNENRMSLEISSILDGNSQQENIFFTMPFESPSLSSSSLLSPSPSSTTQNQHNRSPSWETFNEDINNNNNNDSRYAAAHSSSSSSSSSSLLNKSPNTTPLSSTRADINTVNSTTRQENHTYQSIISMGYTPEIACFTVEAYKGHPEKSLDFVTKYQQLFEMGGFRETDIKEALLVADRDIQVALDHLVGEHN